MIEERVPFDRTIAPSIAFAAWTAGATAQESFCLRQAPQNRLGRPRELAAQRRAGNRRVDAVERRASRLQARPGREPVGDDHRSARRQRLVQSDERFDGLVLPLCDAPVRNAPSTCAARTARSRFATPSSFQMTGTTWSLGSWRAASWNQASSDWLDKPSRL